MKTGRQQTLFSGQHPAISNSLQPHDSLTILFGMINADHYGWSPAPQIPFCLTIDKKK